MESYFVAAYWGARQESSMQCAHRLKSFLVELSDISDDFLTWKRVSSKKSQKTEFSAHEVSLELLSSFLKSGTNRTDDDNDELAELGFRFTLWNEGNGINSASLSIHCGMYSTVEGLSNAIFLEVPSGFDIEDISARRSLLLTFVNSWDPEWAALASFSERDKNGLGGPFFDKALYVSSLENDPVNDVSSAEILPNEGYLYLSRS